MFIFSKIESGIIPTESDAQTIMNALASNTIHIEETSFGDYINDEKIDHCRWVNEQVILNRNCLHIIMFHNRILSTTELFSLLRTNGMCLSGGANETETKSKQDILMSKMSLTKDPKEIKALEQEMYDNASFVDKVISLSKIGGQSVVNGFNSLTEKVPDLDKIISLSKIGGQSVVDGFNSLTEIKPPMDLDHLSLSLKYKLCNDPIEKKKIGEELFSNLPMTTKLLIYGKIGTGLISAGYGYLTEKEKYPPITQQANYAFRRAERVGQVDVVPKPQTESVKSNLDLITDFGLSVFEASKNLLATTPLYTPSLSPLARQAFNRSIKMIQIMNEGNNWTNQARATLFLIGGGKKKQNPKKEQPKTEPKVELEKIYAKGQLKPFPVSNVMSDIEIKKLVEFAPELGKKEKSSEGVKIVHDPNMLLLTLKSSNPHELLARFRDISLKFISLEIQRSYRVQTVNNDHYQLDATVWSVAANFNRMSKYCSTLISQNPTICAGDVFRNQANDCYRQNNPTINIFSDGTELKEDVLEFSKELEAAMFSVVTERDVYQLNGVEKIRGDGWCFYYAFGRYLQDIGILDFISDEPIEIQVFRLIPKQKVASMQILLSDDRVYLAEDIVAVYDRHPIGTYTTLLRMITKLYGDTDIIKEVCPTVVDAYVSTTADYKRYDDIKPPKLIYVGNHFDYFPPGGTVTKTREGSKSKNHLFGIHSDMHYFPNVLSHIAYRSHTSPQYMIGWTFDPDLDREAIPGGQIIKKDGIIEATYDGNSTSNAYSHPTFDMPNSDSVKQVVFNHGKYTIHTLRKIQFGKTAYRIMRVLPNPFSVSSCTKKTDQFLYFTGLFQSESISTANGIVTLENTEVWLHAVGTNSTKNRFLNVKADIKMVQNLFIKFLVELTPTKAISIAARTWQEMRDENGGYAENVLNGDAVLIALILSAHFKLFISDNMHQSQLQQEALASLKNYNTHSIVGVLPLIRDVIERQQYFNRCDATFGDEETVISYLCRRAKTLVFNSAVLISGAVASFFTMRSSQPLSKRILKTILISTLAIGAHFIFNMGRAIYNYNFRKPNISRRQGPLEISSTCTSKLIAYGGGITTKTKKLLNDGFETRDVTLQNGRKRPMINFHRHPLGSLFGKKNLAAQILSRLVCTREPDKNIKTKGPAFGLYPLQFHKCPTNTYLALSRIIGPVPAPDPKLLEEYVDWYWKKAVPDINKKIIYWKEKPTYDEWFKNQKPYVKNAVQRILDDGFNQRLNASKFEIGVKTDELAVCAEKEPRPRAIQQASNPDKLHYRGIWYLCKTFCDIDPSIACGTSWEESAKLLSEFQKLVKNSVVINGDLSQNDSTQSIEERVQTDLALWQDFLGKIIPDFVEDKDKLKGILSGKSAQLVTILEYGDTAFTLFGKQGTGSPDTTLGNTHRNVSRLRWLLTSKMGLREINYHASEPGDFALLVHGDDFIIFITKKYLQLLKDNFSKLFAKNQTDVCGLGHWYKDDLEIGRPDFCSRDAIQRPDGSYRWLRKIKRFLQTTPFTLAVSTSNRPDIVKYELQKMAYIEGVGILRWAKGLPIYHKYALTLIRLGVESPPEVIEQKLWERWERRCIGEVFDYREEDYELTLELWNEAYGLHSELVRRIEDALDLCEDLQTDIIFQDLLDLFNYSEHYQQYLDSNSLKG
jgi:hypothetical protein